MSTVSGSRLKLVGYAALAAINVFLLVAEFMRDDIRWWNVALNVIVCFCFASGALHQGRALKAKSTADKAT